MTDGFVPKKKRRFSRQLIRASGAGVVCALGWLLFTFQHAWFTDNFGVVDPGRAYRVSQPFKNLPDLIVNQKIATILNLRGGSIADAWYVDEVRATEKFGVNFYDIPMSATRRPKRRELLAIIEVINRGRYPLLIHCKSGADRTGLASALYLLLQKEQSPADAMRAFSVEYGHFPFGGAQRLHEPIDEYAAWLARHNLAHSPERFESWVKNDYASDDAFQARPPITPGPRVERETASLGSTDDPPRR